MTVFFLIAILSTAIIIWVLFNTGRKNQVITLKPIEQVLVFFILYSGIIVISSTTTAYDRIADRLLSPIYVPLIIIIFFLLDRVFRNLYNYYGKWFISGFLLIIVISLLSFPVMRASNNINYFIEQSGWQYGSKAWKNNSVLEYLNNNRQLDSGSVFYSNAPEAVYIFVNKETKWSPFKRFYNSPQLIKPKPDLKHIWRGQKNVLLIWFSNVNRKFLFSLNELQKNIVMKKLVQLKDGTVYKILN